MRCFFVIPDFALKKKHCITYEYEICPSKCVNLKQKMAKDFNIAHLMIIVLPLNPDAAKNKQKPRNTKLFDYSKLSLFDNCISISIFFLSNTSFRHFFVFHFFVSNIKFSPVIVFEFFSYAPLHNAWSKNHKISKYPERQMNHQQTRRNQLQLKEKKIDFSAFRCFRETFFY